MEQPSKQQKADVRKLNELLKTITFVNPPKMPKMGNHAMRFYTSACPEHIYGFLRGEYVVLAIPKKALYYGRAETFMATMQSLKNQDLNFDDFVSIIDCRYYNINELLVMAHKPIDKRVPPIKNDSFCIGLNSKRKLIRRKQHGRTNIRNAD